VGSTYVQTMRDQSQVIFDLTGKLTLMKDAQGRQVQLTYTGSRLTKVADAAAPTQRFLSFVYDAANVHITSVSDAAGRTVGYAYDATSGDLTKVTDVMGRITRYTYQNHLLTKTRTIY
jgi:YD repeat-containing protein